MEKNNVTILFLPIDKRMDGDIYLCEGLVEDLTCTIEEVFSSSSSLLSTSLRLFFHSRIRPNFLRLHCVMAQPPSPTPQSSSSLVSVNPPTTVPYFKCNFLDKDTGMRFIHS